MLVVSLDTPIPRLIHQIWLGSRVPPAVESWVNSWRVQNPSFEHMLWTDDQITELDLPPHFYAATSPAAKADILRLILLDRFGGLYVDADFECHRDIMPLLRFADLVVLSEDAWITNSFIASVPGHRLLRSALLASTSGNPAVLSAKDVDILSTTGPLMLNRVFAEAGLAFDPNVNILAPDYLLAPRTKVPALLEYRRQRRYATHHALASWRHMPALRRLALQSKLRTRIRRFVDLSSA